MRSNRKGNEGQLLIERLGILGCMCHQFVRSLLEYDSLPICQPPNALLRTSLSANYLGCEMTEFVDPFFSLVVALKGAADFCFSPSGVAKR